MQNQTTLNTLFSQDGELTNIDKFLDDKFGVSTKSQSLLRSLTELKQMLVDQVVHFVFEKTDGTLRHAYGTRANDVIEKYETGSSKQKQQKVFNGTFPYFDIEKGEWRCFKVDRFVMIDKDYTL